MGGPPKDAGSYKSTTELEKSDAQLRCDEVREQFARMLMHFCMVAFHCLVVQAWFAFADSETRCLTRVLCFGVLRCAIDVCVFASAQCFA